MRTNTATNIETLKAVENRMNHDICGNIVLFPVNFKESAKLFSELDGIDNEMLRLKSKREELSRKADMIMEAEYNKKEHLRKIHEFLSNMYLDDDLELFVVGEEIISRLRYPHAKAIKDHKGRWFRTIKDACEYNDIPYHVFMNRRRSGHSLEECFYKGRLPRKTKKDVIK